MKCEQKVLVPAYNMVPSKFRFGNGNNQIDTHAMEIRCNPINTIILKKMFTRISLNNKTRISFMPTGMLQLTGRTIYKKVINTHNEYNTSPKEMSNIRDNLMK